MDFTHQVKICVPINVAITEIKIKKNLSINLSLSTNLGKYCKKYFKRWGLSSSIVPTVAIVALHPTGERRVDRSAAIKLSKKLTTSTVIIHLNMLGMFVKYHTSLKQDDRSVVEIQ